MQKSDKKYRKVVVGGSFDRLHQGHVKLLSTAALLSSSLLVGLTSDRYVRHKAHSQLILPFHQRKQELVGFLSALGVDFEVIMLEDGIGPSVVDNDIEALVVTQQTLEGAYLVNQAREAVGKVKLPVEVAQMVCDDSQEYLSSTRIRNGEVSREGKVYIKVFDSDLAFTKAMKLTLSKPMGELFTDSQWSDQLAKSRPTKTAVVGDQTLSNFIDLGIKFNYGIFDNQIKRKPHLFNKHGLSYPVYRVLNPAGGVTIKAVNSIGQMLKFNSCLLEVVGEEDLLVLPLLLLMPLGSVIVYGQPDKGVVQLLVTEENKNKWYEFCRMG